MKTLKEIILENITSPILSESNRDDFYDEKRFYTETTTFVDVFDRMVELKKLIKEINDLELVITTPRIKKPRDFRAKQPGIRYMYTNCFGFSENILKINIAKGKLWIDYIFHKSLDEKKTAEVRQKLIDMKLFIQINHEGYLAPYWTTEKVLEESEKILGEIDKSNEEIKKKLRDYIKDIVGYTRNLGISWSNMTVSTDRKTVKYKEQINRSGDLAYLLYLRRHETLPGVKIGTSGGLTTSSETGTNAKWLTAEFDVSKFTDEIPKYLHTLE